MKALLLLEDGKIFEGESVGASGIACGEVVFNTSMTGYQEILTDPSYAGQIVTMTYPLIGNYGVNEEDVESSRVWVKGFIVKELCRVYSNFRSKKSLGDYLKENNIVALEGIDTRALARHIRLEGAMKGVIAPADTDTAKLRKELAATPSMTGADWVKFVTTKEKYIWNPDDDFTYKVAVLDCGVKWNILRILAKLGCQIHVFPAASPAKEILDLNPDGFFVSNGPGDPAVLDYAVDTVKALLGKMPIFGICLGHQIIAQALGAETFKLKFGHRGANHPVRGDAGKNIEITTQNHGFCVDLSGFADAEVALTHINLNDQTLEGLSHKKYPLFSVQYHPEASAGPHDSEYLFGKFIHMMEGKECQNAAI